MKNQAVKTDHKGITYGSQKEMCEAYHVSPSTFSKRMERGWTLQEALEGKVFYSADGVDYMTQRDLCRAYGVHPNSFRRKLNSGMPVDCIIKHKPVRKVAGPDGKKYESTVEMCMEYHVKPSTFYKRMEAYSNLYRALTDPSQKGKKRQ